MCIYHVYHNIHELLWGQYLTQFSIHNTWKNTLPWIQESVNGEQRTGICSVSNGVIGIHYTVQCQHHLDGLVQERCNSSALAMELRLSCTNPDGLVKKDVIPVC